MKKALMIVAMVVLITIAASMLYYFVFFRPEIEKAQLKLQEQKVTEEVIRKEDLEKCLKEAEDWKTEAIDGLLTIKDLSNSNFEAGMKFIQDEYQNKIDNCNSKYGK